MKTHFQDLPPGVNIREWYMDHPVDTTRTKKSLCVGVREILTLVKTLLSTKDKISDSKLLQSNKTSTTVDREIFDVGKFSSVGLAGENFAH